MTIKMEKEKFIKVYRNGDEYEGKWKNNKYEGKGIFYYNDGIDMKVILKMVKEKEKEYSILTMVPDMKVIGKMIKKKEKEK